jgi:hypothetical protein
MNLSSLTSADLKRITALLSRKEQLAAEIQEIEGELASFGSTPKRSGRTARASTAVSSQSDAGQIAGGRARRGQLKEVILTILKEAGRDGVSIQDISSKAGVKPLNVSAWLAATGKKLGTIEKAGRGVYRLKS